MGTSASSLNITGKGGTYPKKGEVLVSSINGQRRYSCAADGVADDRATLLAVLTYAAANMPCTVTFGPGSYAIQDTGIIINPALGSSGLKITGAGKGVTELVLTGSSVFTGGRWHCLRIKPTETANTSITEAAGTYTVTKTAHGYTTGDTVDIKDAVPAALNGRYVITVTGVDTFTYTHTAAIGNSTTHGTSISHDEFLSDFSVEGITFRDSAPATHSNTGVEETHGLNIQSCKNVIIKDCGFDSIGDEGVELDYVLGGIITECYATKTPHQEQTGGGAISVKNGCKDITVSNNVIRHQNLGNGAMIYGINVKLISPFDIDGVSITGNVMSDCVTAGIHLGTADTTGNGELINIAVTGNTIKNTVAGIYRTGGYISRNLSIIGNVITNVTDGMDFDVNAASNLDCNISFNTIETASNDGITCNGTRLNLSGNNFKDCSGSAVYVFDAADVSITGGLMQNCGGASIANIQAQSTGFNVTVEGVQINDAASSSYVIRRCENVHNCTIRQTAPNWQQISEAKYVTGNDLNGGIRTTGNGCIIDGNSIVTAANLNGDGIELNSQTDCIVSNNYVAVSYANRVGIDANNACDYTIFTGNNTRNSSISGRAYLTTNANIIAANNQPTFTDLG